MPSQPARQIIIENFQDSLRLVRHLMNFSVEDFAEAIGVTSQTVNQLETKKTKLSATQYIAVAALTDSYFANHEELFPKLQAIIDSDGKNYDEEYETSFRDDSLLKRWFEDFIDFDDAAEDFPADDEFFNDDEDDSDEEDFPDEELLLLARDYKIFLDAEILLAEDADEFVEKLTATFNAVEDKIVMPLRSIEQLQNAEQEENVSQAGMLTQRLQSDGVLQIYGEETDPDFHDTIIAVFERFRNKYPLCLITPNENLAREVLALNDLPDEEAFKIAAVFVEDGMVNFYDAENFEEDAETDSDEPEDKSSENEINGWSEL